MHCTTPESHPLPSFSRRIEFVPFDPRFKRTEGTLRNTKTGAELKTTKGAPHIILGLLSASDREVKEQVETSVVKFGEMGIRTLAVAKMEGHNGEWKMMGLLTFLDPPRPDTKQTIIDANKYGKKSKISPKHEHHIIELTHLFMHF